MSWEQTEFLWNFGIVQSCDKGVPVNPAKYFYEDQPFDKALYSNIEKGDVVWIKSNQLSQFCKQVLPDVKERIILLIMDGDESFPDDFLASDIEAIFKSKFIYHIFAQNNELLVLLDNNNEFRNCISSMPIGMDFHTIAYRGGGWGDVCRSPREQEQQLKKLNFHSLCTFNRKKKIFCDFQHNDTMHGSYQRFKQFGEDRKAIFEKVVKTGFVDSYPTFMKRSELLEKKSEYMFTISPVGNGLDCHRTWEDLILECIVIIKDYSKLNLDIYDGLPVVIIKDWNEITSENLDKWKNKFEEMIFDRSYREKLTNSYWIKKIQEKKEELLNG